MFQPEICPLVQHDRVFCNKSGYRKGVEDMCNCLNGEKYTKCPVFSQWWFKQVIKEQKGELFDDNKGNEIQ